MSQTQPKLELESSKSSQDGSRNQQVPIASSLSSQVRQDDGALRAQLEHTANQLYSLQHWHEITKQRLELNGQRIRQASNQAEDIGRDSKSDARHARAIAAIETEVAAAKVNVFRRRGPYAKYIELLGKEIQEARADQYWSLHRLVLNQARIRGLQEAMRLLGSSSRSM